MLDEVAVVDPDLFDFFQVVLLLLEDLCGSVVRTVKYFDGNLQIFFLWLWKLASMLLQDEKWVRTANV